MGDRLLSACRQTQNVIILGLTLSLSWVTPNLSRRGQEPGRAACSRSSRSTSASGSLSTSTVDFAVAKATNRRAGVVNYVRVVHMPSTDEITHRREHQAVAAHGQRERVALLRVGIRDEHVAPIRQSHAAELRFGVRENSSAPGASRCGRSSVEKPGTGIRPAVVAEQGGDAPVVRQHPPIRFLGLEVGVTVADRRKRRPLVEGLVPPTRKWTFWWPSRRDIIHSPPGRRAGEKLFSASSKTRPRRRATPVPGCHCTPGNWSRPNRPAGATSAWCSTTR